MVKIRITKLESSHNNLSKSTYEGECLNMPEVGKPFRMYNEFLCTTPIESITVSNGVRTIRTANSTYVVEVVQ